MPDNHWKASFKLTKDKAANHLARTAEEVSQERSLAPRDFEFDDYTRCRNTVIAGAVSLLVASENWRRSVTVIGDIKSLSLR